MNPFLDTFLKSEGARTLLEGARDAFGGGRWVPTPVTDPKLGEAADLDVWWRSAYADLVDAIGNKNPYDRPSAEAAAGSFFVQLSRLTGALPAQPEKNADAALDALAQLAEALPALGSLENQGAATRFRDATFSAVTAAAVAQEHAKRPDQTLIDISHQTRLRDASGELYQLVGDLPEGLRFGEGDTPQSYLQFASQGLERWVVVRRGERENQSNTLLDQFVKQVQTYMTAQEALEGDRGRSRAAAQRDAAIAAMTTIQEGLGQDTIEHVVSGDNAENYVEMSAVFTETMRGVLGLPPREPGQHKGVMPEALLKERSSFGEARVEAIDEDEKDREEPS